MNYKNIKLLKIFVRNKLIIQSFRHASVVSNLNDVKNTNRFETEDNLIYLEDPDNFGTLSTIKINVLEKLPEDEGDLAEEKYLQNRPLPSQKLTTKQYADLIKQYVKHKRIKEALNVLEVRMLTEDKVKPENYIYNILIGACAEVGYTKKAFKLYSDMKRRALKVTGDTYTCLFNACANSPWHKDGLKNAKYLRQIMIEKEIEPNLTNYNAMIKAFGRCGDLSSAFQIVDEMVSKKIKIRVHTFNFLLQACISDKHGGLRHALIVWRKMLSMREKPNIYSFNLMLKCVKECNLGSKEDIEQLIEDIMKNSVPKKQQVLLENSSNGNTPPFHKEISVNNSSEIDSLENISNLSPPFHKEISVNNSSEIDSLENISNLPTETKIMTEIDLLQNWSNMSTEIKMPNFLSKDLNIENVMSLKEVHTLQDKFAIVGKELYFLIEMKKYSVPPNIKTFTQMLLLIEDTSEAESRLINVMKLFNVKTDIDFYNMLIKRRCLRKDHDGAFEVKKMIEEESKFRKKRYPLKKKLKLKPNIMTYGVLAMACDTKEKAEKLLIEMKEQGLKANIEIMGALLKQATFHKNFGYTLFVMNTVKDEKMRINSIFMKHLIDFNEKCKHVLETKENGKQRCSETFVRTHFIYKRAYERWLKEVDAEEALKEEHPWVQFMNEQPEPVQRQNLIEEPKRFYKRKFKFVAPYKP